MNEVIYETVGFLQFEAKSKEVTVETELDRELPFVMADKVQMQQVILNLLLDAIEATENIRGRARRINVRSVLQQDCVGVQIKDNGIGIEDPVRIFESFFTSKRNGMGLGLAISRSIVETNEGRLWAESTVGTGSRFYFTVPVDSSFAE
ncbi:MAG TPA: ATP-binding protein [Candidatus Eisenbacteria bacterium]|nr:ATP-binding protein [Candidatus Eisenbacteria bacterium]